MQQVTENKQGYTLIELIISMGIFMLTMMVVTGIFLSYVRTQRDVVVRQKLTTDLEFAVEQMARDIRLMTIDYPRYQAEGGITFPVRNLYLRDSNGIPVEYILMDSQGVCASQAFPCILKKADTDFDGEINIDTDTEEILTTHSMRVSKRSVDTENVLKLEFYITPQDNPGEAYAQPRVTIVVEVESVTNPGSTYAIETTVTSRMYEYCEIGVAGCNL